MRKKLYLIIRLLVGLVALTILLTRFPLRSTVAQLSSTNWGMFLAACLAGALGVTVSSYKWSTLARSNGHKVPYRVFFRLYLEGIFFSNFLPTSVGGDIHRAYQLGKHTESHSSSLATVVIERLMGLVALAIFALIGTIGSRGLLRDVPGLGLAVGLITIGTLLGAAILLSPKAAHWAAYPFRKLGLASWGERVEEYAAAVAAFRDRSSALAGAFALSSVFNAILVLQFFSLIGAARAPAVSLIALAATVPVIVLFANLPISIGGLGLQESGVVFMFTRLGLSGPQALSVALLSRALILVFASAGGVAWVFFDRPYKEQAAEAEHLT